MTESDGRRTSLRDMRWMFAAVWLLFLGYPIAAVIGSDHGAGVKALGLLILAAFAAAYVWLCVHAITNVDFADAVVGDRGAVLVGLLLMLLTAFLVPIIHEDAFAVAPFLMVTAAYAFAPVGQLVGMVAVMVATVVVPELFGWNLDLGVVAIAGSVGLTMLFARQVQVRARDRELAEERQRQADGRLAVIAERERVARDVHDILGHSLTAISVKTELLGRLVDLDPERAKAEAADVNALAREALAEVRATVGNLRSPELPAVLASARSALTAAGIVAELPEPDDVDAADSTLFAWVLREAVTNVVRHSGASSCTVELSPGRIVVRDDGAGMDGSAYGHGLTGLAERVADAGGALTVDSGPGGTVVTARVDGTEEGMR